MAPKISQQQIQEMFNEGNLIARALYAGDHVKDHNDKIGYDLGDFDKELGFLNSTNSYEGTHANVSRDGSRNRSATLLVPDVQMDLFHDIGLLYDGDKSTIRGYMLHDSATMSGMDHGNFYNINQDKKKFEPILSKKDFLDKYKSYRENTDNTPQENTKYNEVLGNFFPESITGLVCTNNSNANKLKLLQLKHKLSTEKGLDLPIVMMNNGKVQTWHPTLSEISSLLEEAKPLISALYDKTPSKSKEKLLETFAENLGFGVQIKDFAQKITPDNLTVLNSAESSAKEVVDFVHKLTGISKGGKFSYGIKGRLKEVVNTRLENDGLQKIDNLKTAIISKDDIKNLVFTLDKEMSLKNKSHKAMDNNELDTFVSSMLKTIKHKPSKEKTPHLMQESKISDKDISLQYKGLKPADHNKLNKIISNMRQAISSKTNNKKYQVLHNATLDKDIASHTETSTNTKDKKIPNPMQSNTIGTSYAKNLTSNKIKEFFYKVNSLFNEKPIAKKINRGR